MWRWSRKDYKLENQTCLHYVPIDVTSAAIQTLNLVVGYLHKYCATHALTLKLTNQYATISLSEVNSDFKEVMFNSLRLFTLQNQMCTHPQEQTRTVHIVQER